MYSILITLLAKMIVLMRADSTNSLGEARKLYTGRLACHSRLSAGGYNVFRARARGDEKGGLPPPLNAAEGSVDLLPTARLSVFKSDFHIHT
jgi:hypothetical protein